MKKNQTDIERSLAGFRRLLLQFAIVIGVILSTSGYVFYWLLLHSDVRFQDVGHILLYGFVIFVAVLMLYLLVISLKGYKHIRRHTKGLEASVVESEQANKAKTMFLANMTHEIRTPLNAIIGFSEILKKELIQTKNGAYADVIQSSANLLLSTINDILDISKIESGNILLENRPYDIKELLHHISDMYQIRAAEKNLHMNMDIDSRIPRMVRGDSLRLQQVISNLLSNAIKFTPEEGTVTLQVECIEEDKTWVYMKVAVIDTGIGIPKEAKERIFRPFSQADGGVVRHFGGTGLGLSIAQNILKLMDSKLSLTSEPGRGSEFTFKIKLDKDLRHSEEASDSDVKSIALYPQFLALLKMHQDLVEVI